jgi:hypothetical protein
MNNPNLKLPKGVLEFLSRANEQPSRSLFGLAMSDVERQKANDPMMGESVLDMFNRLKKDAGGELPFLPMYAHEALDREISSANVGLEFGKRMVKSGFKSKHPDKVKKRQDKLNELLKIRELYR